MCPYGSSLFSQPRRRADWREAWALFPGEVAYVWHGALHAGTVAESLTASGFAIRSQIIWAKDRLVLSRGMVGGKTRLDLAVTLSIQNTSETNVLVLKRLA
jgi:hypothetical protein